MTEEQSAAAFQRQALEGFLDRLGSTEPVPASGTAAALVGAMAAALVEKTARITDEWDGGRGVAAQARALRARLLALAPSDSQAFRAALDAMRPSEEVSPDDRDAALGRALERAADVPLAIADAAADAAELAAEAAEQCRPAVRADAVAAARLAEGAAQAAALLVGVNLAAVPGDARTVLASDIAARAATARERAGAST